MSEFKSHWVPKLTKPCSIYVLWRKQQTGNIHVCKNEINKSINPKKNTNLFVEQLYVIYEFLRVFKKKSLALPRFFICRTENKSAIRVNFSSFIRSESHNKNVLFWLFCLEFSELASRKCIGVCGKIHVSKYRWRNFENGNSYVNKEPIFVYINIELDIKLKDKKNVFIYRKKMLYYNVPSSLYYFSISILFIFFLNLLIVYSFTKND